VVASEHYALPAVFERALPWLFVLWLLQVQLPLEPHSPLSLSPVERTSTIPITKWEALASATSPPSFTYCDWLYGTDKVSVAKALVGRYHNNVQYTLCCWAVLSVRGTGGGMILSLSCTLGDLLLGFRGSRVKRKVQREMREKSKTS